MRVFVALTLPKEFIDSLAQLAGHLAHVIKGRFLPRENYHVTLAFIGEINDAQCSAVISAMDAACVGMGPIAFEVGRLGRFGRIRDATFWLGLGDDAQLSALALRIREELAARGISFSDKPFRAHITLARHAHLERCSLPELPFFRRQHAWKVGLYKSTLTRDGAIYKLLYEIDLARDATNVGNPGRPHGSAGIAMLERMNESHGPLTEWALDQISFSPTDIVLDAGCGGGATLVRLLRRLGAVHDLGGAHVFGVDHSPTSVSLAREVNAEAVQAGRVSVLEASVEALPFEDAFFDVVVTVESLYFWPSAVAGLAELHRVLKAQGRLLVVLEVYGDACLSEHDRANIAAYSLFVPTRDELACLLHDAGFSHVDIRTCEGKAWIAAIATSER